MKTMMMTALAALAAISVATPASAQSLPADRPVPSGSSAVSTSERHTAQAVQVRHQRQLPEVLSSDQLSDERGGEGIVVTSQTLISILQGSFTGNYAAGDIALSDNALANFNGVGNVLINTGALNNLQTGMNLTINLGR